jgi:site-specific recombinase XerD
MPRCQPRKAVHRPTGLTVPELEENKRSILNALISPHSRRSYDQAIGAFITWYCAEPRFGFNRTVVTRYRSFLESQQLAPATVNLRLSAIRRLARECSENGLLNPEMATGIVNVKGVKRLGMRIGNWLTVAQAQRLISAADVPTLLGKRDAAMLALMIGCGLRRAELVGLQLNQLQRREDHWVIVDLMGKGGRLRAVPIPDWCKCLIDHWLRAAGVSEGIVFRRVLKGGVRRDSGITPQCVWKIVKRCAQQAGLQNLAPHDLRRSCARLCHGSGGELEQIQFLLGHASVQTTERYIGCKQRLREAVNDRFGIAPSDRDG